jgi:DNA-binding MarR family transcriptional regulator
MFTTHDITRSDYDAKFVDKLLKIDPPQRVRQFLQHHLDHNINNLDGPMEFLDHLKYVVLHRLKKSTSANAVVAKDWHTQAMENIHKQHRRQRDHFLSEGFRIANENNPSGPLQVNLNPRELGKHIGYDGTTTTRIMHDLVDEGYVTSGLGMNMMLITPSGRAYLEKLHGDDQPAQAGTIINNITAGASANVQVQNNSANAIQTAQAGDMITELKSFTEQLSAGLPELQNHVDAGTFTDIQEDLEFIKRKLQAPAPSKPLLQTAKEELVKKLVGLPLDAAKAAGIASLLPIG